MTQQNIRYRRDVAIQQLLKARKGKRRSRHLVEVVQTYVTLLREVRETRALTREQMVEQQVAAYFAGQKVVEVRRAA